jgi:hypothetical protein
MSVSLENIKINLIREIKEDVPGMIIAFKTMGLSCVVGTIFKGLSHLALTSDASLVASVISQTCNISVNLSVIIGSVAFVYLMHKQDEQRKLPEYVKIQKKDFDDMEKEILHLREFQRTHFIAS